MIIPLDVTLVPNHFKLTADQGNPRGPFDLGFVLLEGIAIDRILMDC
jgi:hypothetical protein